MSDELRKLAMAATPGPWYHCQPFKTVPAQRTIHGPVPAERVDYVSTWHGMGTPTGHSVVINMAGRESHVRSENMAFIAAANPVTVLAILDENSRLRTALKNVLPHAWGAEYHDEWIGNGVRREACMAAEKVLEVKP